MSEPGFASLGPSLLARKGGAKPAMRPQVAPLVIDQAAAVPDDALEDLGWNDMGHDHGGDPLGDDGLGADIVPINADVSADGQVTGMAMDGGPVVRRQQRRLEERVLADAAMTGPDDREPEYDEYDGEDEDEGEADTGALYGALSATAEPDFAEPNQAQPGYADPAALDDDADDHAPLAAAAVPVLAVRPARAAAPVRAPAEARAVRAAVVPAGRRAAFTLRLDADRHLKLRLAATMQGVSAQALVTEALDRLLAEYDDLDIIANHLKRH